MRKFQKQQESGEGGYSVSSEGEGPTLTGANEVRKKYFMVKLNLNSFLSFPKDETSEVDKLQQPTTTRPTDLRFTDSSNRGRIM
jgi:hypothetical protein